MKALLSIKSEFVKRILSGEKKYEYRRRVFARDDVEAIVIYETLPVGRVVAEVEIEKVLKDTPSALWEETHEDSGITEKFFVSYFSGLEQACAIELGNVRLFDKPLLLSEYNPDLTHAPQSFVYVE